MSPRYRSPVKTMSPRWPYGQDLGKQMSPQHKLLVHLARGELPKSTDPEFLKNIKNADIIILTETWCRNDGQKHRHPW